MPKLADAHGGFQDQLYMTSMNAESRAMSEVHPPLPPSTVDLSGHHVLELSSYGFLTANVSLFVLMKNMSKIVGKGQPRTLHNFLFPKNGKCTLT